MVAAGRNGLNGRWAADYQKFGSQTLDCNSYMMHVKEQYFSSLEYKFVLVIMAQLLRNVKDVGQGLILENNSQEAISYSHDHEYDEDTITVGCNSNVMGSQVHI
jgi:hypothetical protein